MADLRRAMQETGWTVDAVAAAMGAALGRVIDRGYCWRLLNNEKPWRQEYTVALPDDLEGRWKAIGAERREYIVVPKVDDATADRCYAIGVLNRSRRRA